MAHNLNLTTAKLDYRSESHCRLLHCGRDAPGASGTG